MILPDQFLVVCNYRVATKIARRGAKCYVSFGWAGGGWERVFIAAHSRGGRIVEKWEASNKLCRARVKVVPPSHPFYRFGRTSREDAEQIVQWIAKWHAEVKPRCS